MVFSNLEKSYFDKVNQNLERSFNRLGKLTNKNKGSSVNERLDMLSFSYSSINRNILFGTGIGSFSKEYNGKDKRGYPHNILIEIWFELGLIGLLLFSFFLFFLFKDINVTFLLWLVLFVFLNAFKSAELGDLRIMFFILSTPIVYQLYNINEE